MQPVHADTNVWIISINPLLNMGITSNSHFRLLKLKTEAFLKRLPYPAALSSLRLKNLDESHFKSDRGRASAKSQLCQLHAAHLQLLLRCLSQLFQADTVPLFTLVPTMLHQGARHSQVALGSPCSAGEMPPLLVWWGKAANHIGFLMKWKGLLKCQMLFNISFEVLIFIFLWGEVKTQQYWETKGYAASTKEECVFLLKAKQRQHLWGTPETCWGDSLRNSGAHFLWWSSPLLWAGFNHPYQKQFLLQGLLKKIQRVPVISLFSKTPTHRYLHLYKRKNKTSNSNKPLVQNKLKQGMTV